ncbi:MULTISPECIES: type IV secretion protein IcmC [Legionella]|nr:MULTISPECIES: type IV secretion protein IcmC [Legionella]MCC5013747.1 type IV secretion protein IcmC [Legionella sp. 31fI33]
MNSTDLITMIGNLSRSLFPVQHLLSGGAYLLGIVFFMTAISKLRKIGDHRANSSSQEKMFVPLAYIIGGSALLFLPSTVQNLSNTTFGTGNVLQYANYNPYDIYSSMGLIIQTAGLIWFIRGCVLLVTASEPGVQQGGKGLAFLFAGVLAMNFENTTAFLATVMGKIEAFSMQFVS